LISTGNIRSFALTLVDWIELDDNWQRYLQHHETSVLEEQPNTCRKLVGFTFQERKLLGIVSGYWILGKWG
jgi:hypothetical protein